MARRRKKRTGADSHLERKFLLYWERLHGLDLRPVRQFCFAKAIGRRWRMDFAWPAKKVCVELDGGIFIGGGHNRGVQFTKDAEKHNAAVMRGWRILRYTTLDMKERPEEVVKEVTELLRKVGKRTADQQNLFAGEKDDASLPEKKSK